MDSAKGKITKNFFIADLDFCLAALFEKVALATAAWRCRAAVSADKCTQHALVRAHTTNGRCQKMSWTPPALLLMASPKAVE